MTGSAAMPSSPATAVTTSEAIASGAMITTGFPDARAQVASDPGRWAGTTGMTSRVLVTGASGFIGSHLAPALIDQGHCVRAMTRRPSTYQGAGEPVYGDVADVGSLSDAMAGMTAAYYLVHSLGSDDFERRDAEAATVFGHAAADAGLEQIVYLGGLGDVDDRLSAHLRSRRDVEQLVSLGGVPVTVLRAAVIVGHRGISWEITRQLVDHLPAMVTPRWVNTRTQPIALRDVIRYLVGVLDHPEAIGRTFEIGGPEVLSYADMLSRAARIQNHRRPAILPVPLLTPRLSSLWLALITDVDPQTARNLVDSMTNEVVVRDDSIRRLLPGELTGYEEAVRHALQDRTRERAGSEPTSR
ncbi:MAG TPA: NAD(P)H-binding protein [Nakamurella sp.]